jgi:hypothetical protein
LRAQGYALETRELDGFHSRFSRNFRAAMLGRHRQRVKPADFSRISAGSEQ